MGRPFDILAERTCAKPNVPKTPVDGLQGHAYEQVVDHLIDRRGVRSAGPGSEVHRHRLELSWDQRRPPAHSVVEGLALRLRRLLVDE